MWCCTSVQVPESGKIYAFNEGNYAGWEQGLQDYMMSLKDPEKHGGKPYSARYGFPCSVPLACCLLPCWCSLTMVQNVMLPLQMLLVAGLF